MYCIIGESIELESYRNYYSTGEIAPVHMSDVQCSGNESRLIDCPHSPGGSRPVAYLNCHSYGKN